jgi:hypothetical protein
MEILLTSGKYIQDKLPLSKLHLWMLSFELESETQPSVAGTQPNVMSLERDSLASVWQL